MDEKSEVIEMTADIVSAYVGNNSVTAADLPGPGRHLIGRRGAGSRAEGAGGADPPFDHAGFPDLPGGRPQVQVAEAAPAYQVQHEPRGISRQVGLAEGLSDGRAEL